MIFRIIKLIFPHGTFVLSLLLFLFSTVDFSTDGKGKGSSMLPMLVVGAIIIGIVVVAYFFTQNQS